jgi:hypothetical protein
MVKSGCAGAVLTVLLLSVGCSEPANSPVSGPPANSLAVSLPPPPAELALQAWGKRDVATAIETFTDTDWSTPPLFAVGSALNLTQQEFLALPVAERATAEKSVLSHMKTLKRLALAVAEAGRDEALQGHVADARKRFSAMGRCGAALDRPDCLLLVQPLGKLLEKTARDELAKLKGPEPMTNDE